jgi:hypothetical protein
MPLQSPPSQVSRAFGARFVPLAIGTRLEEVKNLVVHKFLAG